LGDDPGTSTIQLDRELRVAARARAAETGIGLDDLVARALAVHLEDAEPASGA
jgi:hypothetical protein